MQLPLLISLMFIGTPLAALTGTADANTIATVIKELTLKEPLILKISPNRENIRISVVKSKKENILCNLDWLVECIKLNGELTPKTIIFCNTMNDIACVANYLMMKLGKWAYYPQERKDLPRSSNQRGPYNLQAIDTHLMRSLTNIDCLHCEGMVA